MSPTPDGCFHLSVEIVCQIHAEAIASFGGSPGIRDMALLESAVAAPQAGFGGKSAYADLVEVAAAYLFFLCRNHPFVDGNKRTGFVAAELFLRLNGWALTADDASCVLTMLAVAAGDITEEAFAAWLREHAVAR